MDSGKKKKLWAFVLSLALIVCAGWTVYNLLPNKFQPVSTLDYITIMVFALLLWYFLAIIKWQKLFNPKRRKFFCTVALVLLLCMLLLNIGIAVRKYNFSKGPNVILISIETLRANHLSCYGYEKKPLPISTSSQATACFLKMHIASGR